MAIFSLPKNFKPNLHLTIGALATLESTTWSLTKSTCAGDEAIERSWKQSQMEAHRQAARQGWVIS